MIRKAGGEARAQSTVILWLIVPPGPCSTSQTPLQHLGKNLISCIHVCPKTWFRQSLIVVRDETVVNGLMVVRDETGVNVLIVLMIVGRSVFVNVPLLKKGADC